MNRLLDANELRIWSRKHAGLRVWHAYDPVTGQHRRFASEADLRDWIDRRYYE